MEDVSGKMEDVNILFFKKPPRHAELVSAPHLLSMRVTKSATCPVGSRNKFGMTVKKN
jgi:hypothetical protein